MISLSENLTFSYSLAIRRLLDIWGTVEDTLIKVKQNSNWGDVLSARLLVNFIELNHQLMDFQDLSTQSDFQHRWTHLLTYLGFARLLTERLNDCWFKNMAPLLNLSQYVKHSCVFDTNLWQLSETGAELLSGSHAGVQALRETQQCLFDGAVPALRLASRSLSSALSMRVCLLVIACLIYPVVIFSFKQMTEWIQNYAQSLKEKTKDLKCQRRLAEDLLHQMLPKTVAKQLRQCKHVEAESYEKVGAIINIAIIFHSLTVYFARFHLHVSFNSLKWKTLLCCILCLELKNTRWRSPMESGCRGSQTCLSFTHTHQRNSHWEHFVEHMVWVLSHQHSNERTCSTPWASYKIDG